MKPSSRVVLDTNVLVSALLTRDGNPAKIYKMFLTGILKLVYCTEILEEYQEILCRPHLKIPPTDAAIVLSAIRQYGEEIRVEPSIVPMLDEDDRIFYDTSKNSKAYLITGNKKHFPSEPLVLTPAEFLNIKVSN